MSNSRVFINLSNHNLTKEQELEVLSIGATQVEVPEEIKKEWGAITPISIGSVTDKFMKFYLDTISKMEADKTGHKHVIVHVAGQSGAVFSILTAMFYYGIEDDIKLYPVYSFTERESVEETQADGSVVKKSVFKHRGFYLYYGAKSRWTDFMVSDGQDYDVSCNSLKSLLFIHAKDEDLAKSVLNVASKVENSILKSVNPTEEKVLVEILYHISRQFAQENVSDIADIISTKYGSRIVKVFNGKKFEEIKSLFASIINRESSFFVEYAINLINYILNN